jgi:hypothetical protein
MRDLIDEIRTLRERIEDLEQTIGSLVSDHASPPVQSVRILIPIGGIAIDATVACRYYLDDHSLSAVGVTLDVVNRTTLAAGDAAATVQGVAVWREGEWQYDNEDCA